MHLGTILVQSHRKKSSRELPADALVILLSSLIAACPLPAIGNDRSGTMVFSFPSKPPHDTSSMCLYKLGETLLNFNRTTVEHGSAVP